MPTTILFNSPKILIVYSDAAYVAKMVYINYLLSFYFASLPLLVSYKGLLHCSGMKYRLCSMKWGTPCTVSTTYF